MPIKNNSTIHFTCKKRKRIEEIEKAIKEIQMILVDDMAIPMDSAKEINKNLKAIQEKVRGL